MLRKHNSVLVLLVLILLFLQVFSLGAAAAVVNPKGADSIKVVLDGQNLSFEAPPINENGRVMVPMRAIFEALGSEVYWCETTRAINATKGDITIRLTLDQAEATVNEETVTLQAPARLINSRTFVPLRFVAEALNCEVNWDGAAQLITITSRQTAPAPIQEPDVPAIREVKDEGDRIAYYINDKLVAEVEVGTNGVRDKCYEGDGWSISVEQEYFSYTYKPTGAPFGHTLFTYLEKPFSLLCVGAQTFQTYFPTEEWRTDPKISQDKKDAIEFVLEEIEARNSRLRPLRGY